MNSRDALSDAHASFVKHPEPPGHFNWWSQSAGLGLPE
jgi:hypothetical protein